MGATAATIDSSLNTQSETAASFCSNDWSASSKTMAVTFWAVGAHYLDFVQLTDEDVARILRDHRESAKHD